MNNTSNKKSGSGRKHGSFSFVNIPIKDLCAKFADSNQMVQCGRLWAEGCGFEGLVSAKAADLKVKAQVAKPENAAQIVVTDLDAATPTPNSMAATVTPIVAPVVEPAIA